ncbi:unnamed protein product [Aureobasidium pullulans]|nr:unnamed protein product [Aureobasidium pullulans]
MKDFFTSTISSSNNHKANNLSSRNHHHHNNNLLHQPLCLASIACNGPRFIKKLKSMAKGLAKKIAGALKAAKDQYVSGSLRSLIAPGAYYHRNKTSNEATRRSPTASPAIRPHTRSEEKDEKERARLLAPLLRSDA